MHLDTGRTNQKLRTRQALLAAARALAARGESVSVTAAAAEAGISKATAYRYLAASDTLAMEAALDGAFATAEEVVGTGGTARERVHRVSRYLFEATRVGEQGFRLFLAKALEASAQEGAPQLRGGRRLPMYALALEPVRERMTPDAFQDLVHALSGATGLEAWLALKDVCRLDDHAAGRLQAVTVDAILDALLPPGT